MDGTGKTTLVNGLRAHLAAVSMRAWVAPPLWYYIEDLMSPEDFPSWVKSNSGTDIALGLIKAMVHRLSAIEGSYRWCCQDTEGYVIVDRGVDTILASARAHLVTASQFSEPGVRVLGAEAQLREAFSALPCETGAVRLIAEDLNAIVRRLTPVEQDDAGYLRYLRALHNELTNVESSVCSKTVYVSAHERAERVLVEVVRWLRCGGASSAAVPQA
jgi:hypothetical protein